MREKRARKPFVVIIERDEENPRAKNLSVSIDIDLVINVNSIYEYDMSGNLQACACTCARMMKAVTYMMVSVYELSPSLLSLINIDRRKRRQRQKDRVCTYSYTKYVIIRDVARVSVRLPISATVILISSLVARMQKRRLAEITVAFPIFRLIFCLGDAAVGEI